MRESPLPAFAEIYTFQELLETKDQAPLSDLLKSSKRLSFLFTKRNEILDSSKCCKVALVHSAPKAGDNSRKYFLLGTGLAKPTKELLRTFKQSKFYFPDRGVFSVHESHISLILDDLDQNEVVYPILDVVSELFESSSELDSCSSATEE